MLKLNCPLFSIIYNFFNYLNTSHVKVKLRNFSPFFFWYRYLNTSHVKVKPNTTFPECTFRSNLNTSHVKVKPTPLLASSLYLYTINPKQSISFQHFFQLIIIFQTFDFSSISVISLENSFLYKYVFSILICCS